MGKTQASEPSKQGNAPERMPPERKVKDRKALGLDVLLAAH
jgi:hypothetical protein